MKIALGIHIGHDRSVCIIKEGKVIAALAQERVDRVKYSRSSEIPFETIDLLFSYCSLNITDVSCIGLSYDSIEGNTVLDLYKDEFFNHYDCEYIPFILVSHHDAHAHAVYYSSGFEESIIFIADGGGDFINGKQEAESIYIGKNGKITCIAKRLQNIPVRHTIEPINHIYPLMPEYVRNLEISLANKYAQITYLLGFGWGEAGKTMGLASYGKSLLDFSKISFNGLGFSLTYKEIIYQIFALQKLSGMNYKQFIKSERANIANTVQTYVEQAIISISKYYINQYHCANLCLSGGLFLNCLANHKIMNECNINNIFILPASGDDGQAIGSAYCAYINQFGYSKPFEINLPYLGLSYTDEEIFQVINQKNIGYERYSDNELVKLIAQHIKNNDIVALHRGRTEIGPRALCHRSIIANPTNANMKNILNNRVKHREEFRPFAPTVITEEQFKYFELKKSSDYMLFATAVREEYREKLSAITHIDNTARVQAISKQQEPFIHSLLIEIKKQIGFPIVLNTSFNVAGQPIVESPLDAINTFLTADIDVLVIGNYVLKKEL
jgi:carbamoyltransferase